MWVLSERSRLDHLQVAIHDGSEMIKKKKKSTHTEMNPWKRKRSLTNTCLQFPSPFEKYTNLKHTKLAEAVM